MVICKPSSLIGEIRHWLASLTTSQISWWLKWIRARPLKQRHSLCHNCNLWWYQKRLSGISLKYLYLLKMILLCLPLRLNLYHNNNSNQQWLPYQPNWHNNSTKIWLMASILITLNISIHPIIRPRNLTIWTKWCHFSSKFKSKIKLTNKFTIKLQVKMVMDC